MPWPPVRLYWLRDGIAGGAGFWLTRDNAVRRTYEISSRDAVTGLQVQGVRFRGVTVGAAHRYRA